MLGNHDWLTGRESEIEQTRTILRGPIEPTDTDFFVERNRGQRAGRALDRLEMKTTIIFNFHNPYYAGNDSRSARKFFWGDGWLVK